MNKNELRKKVLEIREKISDEEIKKRSRILLEKVKEMDEFKKAHTIMVYVSFGKEIYTWDFIQECLDMEKKVITPICNNKDRTLILGKTTAFPEGFHKTKFGILELPADKCEHSDIQEIDFILMPGVAFTRDGSRLGYGAGYYDKLLENKPAKTVTAAPVFEEFLFEEIPMEEHDVKMDFVITDREIFRNR